jgi:putative copper resistance protein D
MTASTPAIQGARRRRWRAIAALGAALGLALGLAFPGTALAHGPVPDDPPTIANLAFGWSFPPLVAIPLLAAAVGWLLLVRRIRRAHPASPVPVRRTAAFLGGLAAIAVALMSGIERYDTTLFSVHMVQHLLLMLAAPPLIALAAPITQVLRAASPDLRRRFLLPLLHSTAARVLGHPLVGWLTFTIVAWASHFSPLFDLALENESIHTVEHVAFLAAGLMFWWPVIAADPAPRRLTYPVRALYLLLQMPPSSFLGMAIVFAEAPLYLHYATLGAPYGINALADQQLAGGIMWLAGDVVLSAAILAVVAAWMRHEERDAPAAERRADAERARLRERADQLARARAAAGDGDPDR